MRQDITETLGQFTPQAELLNRDEILFEAGRASVRQNRLWVWFLVAQLITVIVLWPKGEPVGHAPQAPEQEFVSEGTPEEIPDRKIIGYDSHSVWGLHRQGHDYDLQPAADAGSLPRLNHHESHNLPTISGMIN